MHRPNSQEIGHDFIAAVREHVFDVFDTLGSQLVVAADGEKLAELRRHVEPGKMLRTRLGLALYQADNTPVDAVTRACAATELIHTATLFHDDVIDGASLRRSQPTLWREVGATGAILMGDLFFSSALELLVTSGDLRQTASFVAKVREVCETEMVHEVIFRGHEAQPEQCRQIARGKTGPLFAFVAESCGGSDEACRHALEEAGYAIGTAYQLADDLLDEVGDEDAIGKTLGTDRKRRKFTMAQAAAFSESAMRANIQELCDYAVQQLTPWPQLVSGIEQYITVELQPLWEPHMESVG